MKARLSLKGRGLQLLSQREHSRIELHRKLLRHAKADLVALREQQAREAPRGGSRDVSNRLEGLGEGHSATHVRHRAYAAPGEDRLTDADTDTHTATDTDRERDGGSGTVPLPDLIAEVDEVISWLESKGFFSASRFVESRVNARAPRFGLQRIRQELAQHGVSLSAEELQDLKDTEFDRAKAVWQRKFGQPPGDASERGRQLRFMAARGFSGELVRRIMHLREDD